MHFIDGEKGRIIPLIVGTGGVARGDMVVISSGKVVKAAAAAGDGTIVGIALETVAQNGTAAVELFDNRIATSTYTGTTKTSVVAADLGTVFDLTNEKTVNLDDTTGGMCVCVGFDNNAKTINFVIPEVKKYL